MIIRSKIYSDELLGAKLQPAEHSEEEAALEKQFLFSLISLRERE